MCRKLFYSVVVVALMCGVAQADLAHQWAFNVDSNPGWDSAGGCNATLMGTAMTYGGSVWLDGIKPATDPWCYVDLGGPSIKINEYSALSLVLWSTQYPPDQGWSMTAAFGATNAGNAGIRYVAIATSRGDGINRAMMTRGVDDPGWYAGNEQGVNSYPELNDEKEHMYVLTVGSAPCGVGDCTDNLVISYYIDGQFIGMMDLGDRLISGLSNDKAYLGQGTYPGDGLWAGGINEFDIYSNALTCAEIQAAYAAGPSDVVPEPATMVLLGFGSLALIRRRKS